MRKLLMVLLCFVLLFTTISVGCTNGKSTDKEEVSSAKEQENTEPIEISIMTFDNYYSPKSYSLNLPVWQEVEKALNIKIKWEVTPHGEYTTVLQTKLAAGKDLADLICHISGLTKYIKGGLFTQLNDLIDQYGPNIKRIMEEKPEVKAAMTQPDGKIYSFTTIGDNKAYIWTYLIRQDWLQKANLELPKTTEDLYVAMKAFREKDVNESGKADEILSVVGFGQLEYGGTPFGMHPSSGNYAVNESGQIEYDYLMPRGKEFLSFLNKAYSENLIDPEVANLPYDKFLARLGGNLIGVSLNGASNEPWYDGNIKNTDPNAKYIALSPLKGPGGIKMVEKSGSVGSVYAISRDCKDPVAVTKFVDFVFGSEEGQLLMTFGVEGISYNMIDGKPQLNDFALNNPDGLSLFDALRSIGAYPNTPYIQSYDVVLQGLPAETSERIKEINKYAIEPFPFLWATQDEDAELSEILPDLGTYISEMKVKFMIGDEPLSNYDAFISKLKEMKIERVIQIKQQQYDRAKGK